ncbi:DUF6436 domain-containing protein [Reinekea thalattae]|uniref:DUF6436 domain-containing protein n=1 Tax=Reinekea thalattae TaxID=2593301 RepID=A0A5C8Z4M7_9GAMM|nr:DUF6436 domain-containing protein [Reinekea thalattae]TXR51890.1 hypothetical protein FME95_10715 [Reinekea thalattae]
MQKKHILAAILIAVWVPASLVLLKRFGDSYTGVFDPNFQLKTVSANAPELISKLDIRNDQSAIIHVLDKTCSCYEQTAEHVNYLADQMPAGVAQRDMSVAELAKMGIEVPATPMTILIRNSELQYVGPYATGPLCTPQSDIILPILEGKIQLPNAWLNSTAVACRCPV